MRVTPAHEKEQTSATHWFCIRKNQILENCRGAYPLLQAAWLISERFAWDSSTTVCLYHLVVKR
jgi:hypothetical protein